MEDPRDPFDTHKKFNTLSEPISQVRRDVFDSIIFPSGDPDIIISSCTHGHTPIDSSTGLPTATRTPFSKVTSLTPAQFSVSSSPTTFTLRVAFSTTQILTVLTVLTTITPTLTPTPAITALGITVLPPVSSTHTLITPTSDRSPLSKFTLVAALSGSLGVIVTIL
ncbi:hypothetical protein EW026_g7065, partial [Hermanssonia centrifuga]